MNPDNQIITFQWTTHYLPKIAVRIESLCQSAEQACHETHPVIHQVALHNILEIIKIIEKPELKSRFLKEFLRMEHACIKQGGDFPFQKQLHDEIVYLNHTAGRFGEAIQSHPLLQSIRSGQSNHHEIDIDCPQLLFWLKNDPEPRQHDLRKWLKCLQPLHKMVSLYLSLLKHTAVFEVIPMPQGFYQRNLPPRLTCQLILCKINRMYGLVPKIQLGNYGISLRLYEAETMREAQPQDAFCELAICQT
ncbi:MAG: cell division protein ZapD [Legionellaceae bacterium]|nr:cell division protein ZapD [Legionellaceae bacterium]